MALRMWHRPERPPNQPAPWVELDLVASRACDFRLQVSYNHPARLTWKMYAAQHTTPIPLRSDIVFLDTDHYDPTPLTDPDQFTNPTFEGHVQDIQPADSLELIYTAYDPTYRAGQEIVILSGGQSKIPRLVYNAKIEQDDDYAFNRRLDGTIAEMLQDMLDDAQDDLEGMLAAPVGGTAYVLADLTPLDAKPQEKLVFETEGLRSGLDRLLEWYPQYRLIFHPGASGGRKWRLIPVKTATATTLTLNDFSPGVKHVLSMNLQRSMERRYTAVEILGPLKITYAIGSQRDETSGGHPDQATTLTKMWDSLQETTLLLNGPNTDITQIDAYTKDVYRKWQITDPTMRALARLLPQDILVPYTELGFGATLALKRTRMPTLLVQWSAGGNYEAVEDLALDVANGIISTSKHVVRKVNGVWTAPYNLVLHFAYYGSPITVREPEAADTYEGTAYTVAGLKLTFQRYDEALIVGYDKNDNFVTEDQRKTEFRKLARNILEASKDVVYAGGCVLEGLDYDFLRLARRLNFAGVDGDGAALTTGWEAVNAILTDVEYDYENRVTTLTFSSDHLEFSEIDPERLKEILKIEALTEQPKRITIVMRKNGRVFQRITMFTEAYAGGYSIGAGA